MEPSTFLEHVLGTEGYYCVFGTRADSKRRIQKFYTSIDRAVAAAQDMDANDLDAYFALATFETDEGRTKDNAKQLRALFLDLDCGAKKPFPTQPDAVKALRAFCKDVGLPKPTAVNSGRGIHVYWPLIEPANVDDWLPVAQKLKRVCAAAGFEADPAVTADAARILRMPGTRNHKDDPPAPVEVLGLEMAGSYDLDDLSARLDGYAGSIKDDKPFVPSAARVLDRVPGGNALMQRLMGNAENVFRTIMQRTAAGTGCEQLGHIALNQNDIDEPLWRGALSIAKFCSDGAEAAHKISRGHDEYDPDVTERKLKPIKGPYRCQWFDEHRPGVCAQCPHFGKITSPIVLGRHIKEAQPEDNIVEDTDPETGRTTVLAIPDYPKPYFRGKNGGVYIRRQAEADDIPEEVCIYPNDLYFTQRVFDEEFGEMLLAKLHLPRDGVRTFVLSLTQATSKDELRKELSKQGVVATYKGQWELIMSYTSSWVADLQANTIADKARRQFGWTDDKMTSFCLGAAEVFGDRVEYNPPSSATAYLYPAFEPRGTLKGWIEQADFYNREGMEAYQFKIGHTLGSPLMRLTAAHAAIFAIYSDGSGRGKTTTQEFALTAFGDPRTLMFSAEDTPNSRMNRLEVFKDLPAEFDELTEMGSKAVSSLVYQSYEGRQKARMSSGSNAERLRGDPWRLCIGMSSNVSPIARIMQAKSAPKGEIARVLEHHIQPYKFSSKSETDAFAPTVGDNTGQVAVPYLQYIINNRDEVSAVLRQLQSEIDRRADLSQPGRFWSYTAAVSLTSIVILRKLGFVKYDMKRLMDWAVEMVLDNKRRDLETVMRVENVVTEYVADMYSSILWIKSTEDARSTSHGSGLDTLMVPEHEPRGRLVGRYETDVKRLYLLPKPLRDWCSNQQLNYDSVLSELMDKMNGERKKVRISKGTKLNLPPADVIIIDCAGMDIQPETEDGGAED